MPRLRGPDAGFLLMESQGRPATLSVVLRLVPGEAPLRVEGLRDHVAARLDRLGWWDLRLEPARAGLRFPSLVRDERLDLDYHVRHHVLARGGAPNSVDEMVSMLAQRPLHRGHPLWQLHLLDGAGDGSQTLVWLLHHAMGDGVAIRTVLGQLCNRGEPHLTRHDDLEEVVNPPLPDESPATRWRDLPALARSTRRGLTALQEREATSSIPVPRAEDQPPRTSLDASGSSRALARTVLSFDELRAVRDAAQVSFTDVLIAAVAGALRRILDARGEAPSGPLVVNVPTVRASDARPRLSGNRFANYLASLATDVEDPRERLAHIAAVSAEARTRLDAFGSDTVARWLDLARPVVAEPLARRSARGDARLGGRGGRGADGSSRARPLGSVGANVLLSNVGGSEHRWMFDAATVDAVHVVGPLTEGEIANVTTFRYAHELDVSVLLDPDAAGSAHDFGAALHAAVAELVDVTRTRSVP